MVVLARVVVVVVVVERPPADVWRVNAALPPSPPSSNPPPRPLLTPTNRLSRELLYCDFICVDPLKRLLSLRTATPQGRRPQVVMSGFFVCLACLFRPITISDVRYNPPLLV